MSAVSSPTRRCHDGVWRGGADWVDAGILAAIALRESAGLGAVRGDVALGGVRAGGVAALTAGELGLLAARAFGAAGVSRFARAGAGGGAALGVARVGAAGDPE